MKYPYFFFVCLILSYCAKKVTIPAPTDLSVASSNVEQIINSVNANGITAKYIQAKGQVTLDDGGFFSSGSLTLRVAKDSLLWFSITKLGFEITRGMINRDSAFAINNWENTYWKGSLEDIAMKYNVPATFKDIQSIAFPTLDEVASYRIENKGGEIFINQSGALNKKIVVRSMPALLIQSLTISHASSDFKVVYSDYSKKDFWFPFTHNHTVRNGNDFHQTKMRFNTIEAVNKINTPFRIPEDFELIK